jgi:Putative bacterial sensory transduction regulator
MSMIPRIAVSLLAATIVGGAPAAAPAQAPQTVYKNVSSEALERVLQDMRIGYKKTPGNKDGVFYYEYDRNGFTLRLHNYAGTDLWIEALFSDRLSLEDVNRWNVQAKFSRCVLLQSNDKTTTALENQVDCRGGCTDAMVRQFVNRFDHEVRTFADFVKKTQAR